MHLPPASGSRLAWGGFVLSVSILFLIANRGAYRSFFSDDDFDHIYNASGAELSYYGIQLATPKLGGQSTFRPPAHFYYWAMARLAGLNFRPYIAGIHVLHLLNVAMVCALALALGASPVGAAAAGLLFAFHIGVFLLYWEPMYIFDTLCATFTLAMLLSYVRGRLILSLILFWLALKSKEVAILVPLVLAGYEWWFGGRRWKRLIPFFAISLILGIQALIDNAHRGHTEYSLSFTPSAVWTCARFYASKLVLAPEPYAFAGFAVLVLPFVIKNRLVRFGVFSFFAFLLMMLVLPGRLFGAYLYIPLIGLAIALSAATRPVWLAICFALWIPWNYQQMRTDRKRELAAADERRIWFQPIANFARNHPDIDTFVWDGAPESLAPWGVNGALNLLRPKLDATVTSVESPNIQAELVKPNLAVVVWDPVFRIVRVLPRVPDVSYIRLSLIAPLWQLGEGWIGHDPNFRWISPHATARLYRPANARNFEVIVYVSDLYIEKLHQGQLDVWLNHKLVGGGALEKPVPTTFHFALPPGPEGPVEVEFDVTPGLKDPNGGPLVYGAPVAAFGFIE